MKIKKVNAKEMSQWRSPYAHGLTGHFLKIKDGASPTKRSPLYKGVDESTVINNWVKCLQAHRSQFPRLIDYELSRRTKVGLQGGYPPLVDRMGDLQLYFTPRDKSWYDRLIASPSYKPLLDKCRKEIFGAVKDMRKLPLEQCLQVLYDNDKLNTNSGAPDFGKRSDEEIKRRALADAKTGVWQQYPAILGSRSSRQKARFVFMFPMSTNLIEMQFTYPLMQTIRKHGNLSFSAWEGFDDVTRAIYKQNPSKRARLNFSMDYSKMDTTVREEHTKILVDLLSPLFQPKYREELRQSLEHVNNIPIWIEIDKVVTGVHGYASGSGWTNLGESLLSYLVHAAINEECGPFSYDQMNGDDGIFGSDKFDDPEVFISNVVRIISEWGFDANAEKQDCEPHTFHYLQRFFDDTILNSNGALAGSYPTVLALNAGMNPERFHDPRKWSGDMESLRWIMILENCNQHPLFHEIIEYFIKGDKYGLGIYDQGFLNRLPSLYEEAKRINDFVPSYNQSSIDRGILDFEVVKYLQRKIKSSGNAK